MSVLDKAYQSFIQDKFKDEQSRKKADLRAKQFTASDQTEAERGASLENTADRALIGIEQGRQAIIRGIPGFVLSNIPVDSIQQTGRRLTDENIRQQAELSQAGELIGGGTLGAATQLLSNVGIQMAVPLGASRGAAATIGKLPYTSQIAAGLTRAFPSTVAAARGTAITSGGISGEALAATAGGAGASALQSASGTYSDALQAYLAQGLNRDEAESKANLAAILSGIVTGTVTAGFGATGLEALRKSFSSRPVREAIKEAIKQGGAEGTEESVDQIGQSIIQKLTYNPDLTFEQAAKEVGIAFALGNVMGAGLNAAANTIPVAGQAVDMAMERRLPRWDETAVNELAAQAEAPKGSWVLPVRSNARFNPFPFQYQEESFIEDIQPDQRDVDPTAGVMPLDEEEAFIGPVISDQIDSDPSSGISSLEQAEQEIAPFDPVQDEEVEINPSALDDEPSLAPLQDEIEEPQIEEGARIKVGTEENTEAPIADQTPVIEQPKEKILPSIESTPTTDLPRDFYFEDEVPEVDVENNQISLIVAKGWSENNDPLDATQTAPLPFGLNLNGIGERLAFLNFKQNPDDGTAAEIGIGSFVPAGDGSPQWAQILTLNPDSEAFKIISGSISSDQESITIPWDLVNPNTINSEESDWRQIQSDDIQLKPLPFEDEGSAVDDPFAIDEEPKLPKWLEEWSDMPPELVPTEEPVDLTDLTRPADLPKKLGEAYVDYAAQNEGNVEGWNEYLEATISKVRNQTVAEDLDKIVKIKSRQKEEYPNKSTGQFSYDILGITKDGEEILLDQVGPFEWAKYQYWKMGHSGRSQEQIDADKKKARTKSRIEKSLIEWAYNRVLEDHIASKPKQPVKNEPAQEEQKEQPTSSGLPEAPPNVSINQIDKAFAERAFYGTSHDPERRGESWRNSYVNQMQQDWDYLKGLANKSRNPEILEAEFERYREGFLSRFKEYLSSHAGVMSSMITGPANFPVARNQKKSQAADNKLNAAYEYRDKALKSIKRKMMPEDAPIQTGDAEAVERLEAKLARLEDATNKMKAANAVTRKYTTSKNGKIEYKKGKTLEGLIKELKENVGLSDTQINEFYLYNRRSNEIGFPKFYLTNNNAEIRRTKQRIEEVKAIKDNGLVEKEFTDGTRYEENPDDGRVRFFFDGKPDAETIGLIKSNGFRWSPKNQAWQRQLTSNGKSSAKRLIAELELQEVQEGQPAAQDQEAEAIPEPLKPEVEEPTLGEDQAPLSGSVIASINQNVTEVSPSEFTAQGKEGITALLRSEEAGISSEQVGLASALLNEIPEEFLSDLTLKVGPSPGEGQVNLQGSFSYLLNQANVFTGATDPTVALEEIAHSLARFLPADIRSELTSRWKAKLNDVQGSISENPNEVDILVGDILQEVKESNGITTQRFIQIVESSDVLDHQAVIDQVYPYINLDEFFAHGITGKVKDAQLPQGAIGKAVEFLKSLWDSVKRFFGLKNQDLFDSLIDKFKKGEFSPNVDNGMLFESNVRIPSGALTAFSKTEMAQQVAAAKAGMNDADGPTTLKTIAAGISPSVKIFKKYTQSVSPSVIQKLGIKDSLEVEADIVAAVASVPDLDTQITEFEKNGHIELANKLRLEVWQSLSALNTKFERVYQAGNEAKFKMLSDPKLLSLEEDIVKWQAETNERQTIDNEFQATISVAIAKNLEILKSETASLTRKEVAKDMQGRLDSLKGAKDAVRQRVDEYMKILMQDTEFINQAIFDTPRNTNAWVKSLLKKVKLPRGMGVTSDAGRIAIRIIATNEGVRKAYAAARFSESQSKAMKDALSNAEKMVLRALRGKSKIISIESFIKKLSRKSASAAQAAVILDQKLKEYKSLYNELSRQAEAGMIAAKILSDPEWRQLVRSLGDPIQGIIYPSVKGDPDKALPNPEDFESTTYVPIPINVLGQAEESLIPLKLTSSDYRNVDSETWSKNYRDLNYARERIAAWLAQNPDSIYAPYYNRWHEMLNGFYLSDVVINPPSFVNAGKPLTSILSVPIIMLEGMGIRSAQAAKIFAKQWERIHTMATKIPEQYQAKWSNLVTKATEDHLPGKARIGDGNHQTWFTKVYSYLADSWQGGKKPFKVGDMLPSGEKVMASDMAVVDLMAKLSKMLVDMTNAIDPKNPDRRVQLGSFSDGTRVDDTNAGRRAQRGILSVGEKMMGRTVSGRGIGAAELMGDIWQWAKYENGTWSYNQDWLSMSEDDRLNANMPNEVADFIKKLDEFEVDQDIIMSTLWDRGADTQYSAEMFTRKDGLESVYPIIVQEISEGKLEYSGTNIVRRITELSADPITEAEAAARFTRDIQRAWKPLWKTVTEQKSGVKTSNHNQIVSFLESNNFTLGRTDKIAPSIAYSYGAENNYMFHVMAHNAAASQYNQFMKSLEAVESDLSKAKAFMRLKKNQVAGKKGGVQSEALKEVVTEITKRAKDPNNVTDFEIAEEIDSMQRQVAELRASLNEVYSQSGQDIKAQFGPVNFTWNRTISTIITPTIGQWKTLFRNYAEFPNTIGVFTNKMGGSYVVGYLSAFKALMAPKFFSGIRMVGGGVKGFSKGAKAAWKVMDGILSDMISLHVGKAKTKALQGFEQLVANIAMEATHAALYKTEDFKRLKDLGLAQIMDIPAVMESLRLNPKTGGAIRDVSMRNPTHNMLSGMANGVLSFVEYFTTPVLKSAFPRIADETVNSVAISIGIAKAQEIQVQLFKAYQFLKESGQLSQFDLTNPYSKQNIDNFKPEFLIGRKGLLGKQNLKTAYDTLRETFANAQIPSLPAEAAKYWADMQAAEAIGSKLSDVQFLSDGQRSAFGYEFATYVNAPTALNRNISLKKYGSLGRSIFLLGGYPMTLLARIAQIPRRSIKDPNYTRMLGTLTTALILGAFVAGSGFSEVVLQMFFREVVDPFQGEEKKARMFWEEDTEQGMAFNMLQQVSNRVPFIGTVALNMLLTDQPTKNELEPFSLLKDKAGDAWNYVAGAIRTGDPTYNLSNTLKSYFPITKPLLNRLPGASGISEHMNAKRLISVYAPEDLRKSLRGYVGGGTTATELSPYGLRILNAIMNEDQAEAKSLFNEAIEVAMRQDGDTYSRAKERIEQKIANMSPWRQRLKRTPTYTERQEMLNKMSPDEQRFIIQAERKLAQGASMFGVNINFFKQGTEIGGLTKKIRQRNQSRFNLSNPWGQGGAFGNVSALKPLNPFR